MAALLTLGATLFSVRSLPYGYASPKQDYKGAIDFVTQRNSQGDQVAVVGQTAALPILDYFGRPWRRIDRAEQLRDLRAEGREAWLIYTFPAYIKLNTPDLWRMIQVDCEGVNRFSGTIAGGDIEVYRCPP